MELADRFAGVAVENKAAVERVLKITCSIRDSVDRLGTAHHVALVNVCQFALLFNYDLSCLLHDLTATQIAWHRRLHARHLALTLVECVEDFTALLGKPFRRAISELRLDPATVETLNSLSAELHAFQRQHDRFLRSVRNYTIAHREHDATIQLQWINDLEPKSLGALGDEMMRWTARLHVYLHSVILGMIPSLARMHDKSAKPCDEANGGPLC